MGLYAHHDKELGDANHVDVEYFTSWCCILRADNYNSSARAELAREYLWFDLVQLKLDLAYL